MVTFPRFTPPTPRESGKNLPRARLLIAGTGNIFLGDDGFGVEVVEALAGETFPPRVVVRDFGIRRHDLAFALTDSLDAAILLEATPRHERPGTLTLLELAQPFPDPAVPEWQNHRLDPGAVLKLAANFGTLPPLLFLVGCEPATLGDEAGAIGLSPAVRAAVPRAVEIIRHLVSRLTCSPLPHPGPRFATAPDHEPRPWRP